MKAITRSDTDLTKTWNDYLKTRELALRNSLVMHYSPIIDTHTRRIARRLPAHVTSDEIRSAAFEGLIQAVESYNPDRPAKFETYCQRRILGAVMDWLRSLDHQSRTIRTFEKKRGRIKTILDTEIGRPPTHKEIASRMKLSIQRYERLSKLALAGSQVHFSSIESSRGGCYGNSTRNLEIKDNRIHDPALRISRDMLTDYITKGFTPEERMILVLYYYEDLTMAEIGSILNLSESRVSQIHKSMLGRLRERFGKHLAEELII